MIRRILIQIAVGAVWFACTAPGPAVAMVPEDIFDIRTVQPADLSPDGRYLLYRLGEWDTESQQRRSVWYRRDLQTEEDLLLFTSADQASDLVWRPDGEAIAYLRHGDAGTEIWLMDADGGDRHRIDQGTGPRGKLHWAPDGSALAWIATAGVGNYDGVANAVVVADDLSYRHLGEGYREGRLRQLYVMNPTDGTPRRLLDAELDVRALAWSPDATQLVFEAKAKAEMGRTVNTDLWRIDRTGGHLVPLTTNPGADSNPVWLANGSIAWARATDPLGESAPRRIAVARPEPEAMNDPRLLGTDLDDLLWRFAPLGENFVALVARRGCLDLVLIDENHHEFLTEGGYDYWSLLVRGTRVVLQGAGQTLPGAIFLMDTAAKRPLPRQPRILIDPNRQWSRRVPLIEPERFEVEVDGRSIEGWFFRPSGVDRQERVPVVLSIHGGPEWMYGGYFLPEFHILPRFGYGVLIANPTGSVGYGFEFQSGVRGDWVDRPARELMACLDHVINSGWADSERLAVMGGSYGGHLGAALTTQSNRFRAAALDRMHPDLVGFWGTTDEKWFPEWEFLGRPWDEDARDVYRRNSPINFVDRVTTPTLVSQGMRDYRCLIAGGEAWFSALQSLGVPSRFLRFENEGHGIRNPVNQVFYQQQLLAWFDSHVLGSDETHEEESPHE